MALKVKLDDQDQETATVDIPLFATATDAVKDIQVDDEIVIKVNVQSKEKSL